MQWQYDVATGCGAMIQFSWPSTVTCPATRRDAFASHDGATCGSAMIHFSRLIRRRDRRRRDDSFLLAQQHDEPLSLFQFGFFQLN